MSMPAFYLSSRVRRSSLGRIPLSSTETCWNSQAPRLESTHPSGKNLLAAISLRTSASPCSLDRATRQMFRFYICIPDVKYPAQVYYLLPTNPLLSYTAPLPYKKNRTAHKRHCSSKGAVLNQQCIFFQSILYIPASPHFSRHDPRSLLRPRRLADQSRDALQPPAYHRHANTSVSF